LLKQTQDLEGEIRRTLNSPERAPLTPDRKKASRKRKTSR
jgi:hypothetical protein